MPLMTPFFCIPTDANPKLSSGCLIITAVWFTTTFDINLLLNANTNEIGVELLQEKAALALLILLVQEALKMLAKEKLEAVEV